MVETLLEKNEKIETQESTDFYSGEGVKAALKSKKGELVLTNDRLVAVRRIDSVLTWLPIVLVIPIVIIFDLEIITAGIVGGIIGGLGYLVMSKIFKGKLKETPDFAINRKEITDVKAEESIAGITIFTVTTNNEVWSFHTKNKEKWNELLNKK